MTLVVLTCHVTRMCSPSRMCSLDMCMERDACGTTVSRDWVYVRDAARCCACIDIRESIIIYNEIFGVRAYARICIEHVRSV